ncbi:hypothetical protein CPT_Stills75 [Bacillus phage Stills]|uniref:Uncharacterized protein n=1 Tax=Bacillus phage Stills TaxID=1610833 RepID=A0A0E3XB96_9CAUD|nr:hypothetical protein CPT_Stills75 [Bacillus phage Stills]AKC02703.1 hypothetical protein CPT_Stills75 [Bacillus phage Stills]
MPRVKRGVSMQELNKKWKEQDTNNITVYDKHNCRMPNDFTDWSSLSGEVVHVEMTKEEINDYISKRSR